MTNLLIWRCPNTKLINSLITIRYDNNIKNYNSSEAIKQFNKTRNDALDLFKRKNSDYGDAFATYGIIGIIFDYMYRF